jgi:hypothetical protein
LVAAAANALLAVPAGVFSKKFSGKFYMALSRLIGNEHADARAAAGAVLSHHYQGLLF